MRIIVIGGNGDLGSRAVLELGNRGHDVFAASRRTGVDVTSGTGLTEVLGGADAVVLCAMNPLKAKAIELTGTKRVLDTIDRLGSDARPHVVYISIVGCDAGGYVYYTVKADTERLLEAWSGPATVLRATQFHSLAALMAGLRIGRVGLRVGGMRIRPVDIGFVAKRLADLAAGQPPERFVRATDVTGPDTFDIAEIADLIAAHDGRSTPRLLRLPAVGAGMRLFGNGGILPTGSVEVGGEPFTDWLARQPVPLPRAMHDPLP